MTQAQKQTNEYGESYYEIDGAVCNRPFAINDSNTVEIEDPWGENDLESK